jgi:SAM-dependent methyltransferase
MSNIKIWNTKNLLSKTKYRFFPQDMMLRALFSDNYFSLLNKKLSGAVLDVGTLYGNNLVPFADRGWDCYGTEVTDEAVQIAKSSSYKWGMNAKIKLGFNKDLPFEDQKFDLLLSMSTIHYEEKIEDIELSLKEFSRTLKKDGHALVQTVAPKHVLFVNSRKVNNHIYKLDWPEDLHKRDKEYFVFFDNYKKFKKIALKFFSKVEVARCTEKYPNRCFDMWLFKMLK